MRLQDVSIGTAVFGYFLYESAATFTHVGGRSTLNAAAATSA